MAAPKGTLMSLGAHAEGDGVAEAVEEAVEEGEQQQVVEAEVLAVGWLAQSYSLEVEVRFVSSEGEVLVPSLVQEAVEV